MTELSPTASNLTRSLSKVKSKISSKFKNAAEQNETSSLKSAEDDDKLLVMKYDDLQENNANESVCEMRQSKSITSLNNMVEEISNQESNHGPIDSKDSLLPPVQVCSNNNTRPITMIISENDSEVSTTPSSIQEKEFSFLQQQLKSNQASPISSRRHDSIIDPLNTSLDRLSSIQSLNNVISPQPTSISSSPLVNDQIRRKSSNISNISMLQQPITPTNELPISTRQESLEFADAMALSILNKVDEIKIEESQGIGNVNDWSI